MKSSGPAIKTASSQPAAGFDCFPVEPGRRNERLSEPPSWIQLEMAQAINAAHIHTVLTVRVGGRHPGGEPYI
jgi:hypothetical protein